MKGKGEEQRYTHLNAEFQRIARRDKKAFLSDQCKEIEENNRMGKTRDLFKSVITHLESDTLECKVNWALGSITMNKTTGSDGIPADIVQILKDDAVKVLYSICQQIWKIRQWLQDWKR